MHRLIQSRSWRFRSRRRSAAPACPARSGIVARITADPHATLSVVQFYVDGKLVGEDKDGPPYAVEWTTTIRSKSARSSCRSPIRSARRAQRHGPCSSRSRSPSKRRVERAARAAVLDPKGRPVNGLTVEDFTSPKTASPQTIELARAETVPATYTLLIDSSSEHVAAHGFRARSGARAAELSARRTTRWSSRRSRRRSGRSPGRRRIAPRSPSAIDAIDAGGGTAILDCLAAGGPRREPDRRPAHPRAHHRRLRREQHAFRSRTPSRRSSRPRRRCTSIAIGGVAGMSLKGEDLLRRLAIETGGRAFFPARDFQLADIHALIAADMQQRYVAHLHADEPEARRHVALDHRRRPRIRSRSSRSRTGYCAPAPPPIRPELELTIRDANRRVHRRHAGRHDAARGRRRAEDRRLRGGPVAGLGHAAPRFEREHAEGRRRGDCRGAVVRRARCRPRTNWR